MARRTGWGLGDQALSSLTNFALSVAVARVVTADAFGAFGLAITVYTLCIGLVRALTSEPLLVRYSTAHLGPSPGPTDDVDLAGDADDPGPTDTGTTGTAAPSLHHGAAQAAGMAVVTGVVTGVACVVFGALSGGLVAEAMIPLGLLLPALLLQDTWRYAFFAGARPARATANDLVWTIAQLVLAGAVILTGHADVTALVLAWGLAAACAAAVGCIQTGVVPRVGASWRWARAHGDLIPGFVGEFVARNGARQLTVFGLAVIGGLGALAAMRGAQVLFGPLNVLLLSVGLVAIPEAVRIRARHPARLRPAVYGLSGGLAAIALAAGVAALAIPDSLGTALLGDSWASTRPVLIPQAVYMASVGATSGYLTGLRALAAATDSLAARVVIVPLSLAGGIVGALVGDATGAVTGLAVSNWIGVAVWHRQFSRALRRSTTDRAGEGATSALTGEATTGPGSATPGHNSRAEAVELRAAGSRPRPPSPGR